jgi:glycosyltransferase involved in cell wall biosynthesis
MFDGHPWIAVALLGYADRDDGTHHCAQQRIAMSSIDVVVPCYRYGHFLRECVESVLNQSIQNVRVLIIDDASPDNTADVAAELVKKDPRVIFVRHRVNKGHIATYNEGIEWASADYFLLLSSDDLLVSGAFARATKVMEENPDIVLTHGKFIEWHDHLPFPEILEHQTLGWRRQDLIRETCATGACLVSTPTAIARTAIQKVIGGYRPSLPHAGDMEMWLRFAAHGAIARIENAVQAISRRHRSNMSNPYFAEKLPDFEERKKVFDSFFEEYGDRVAGSRTLRAQTDRILTGKIYISGVARLYHGDIASGLQLLRYSMHLNPKLRYCPPIALAIELKVPGLIRLAASLGSRSAMRCPR